MIGVLIKSIKLNIIISWSTKFMVIKGIVMQFRGIMPTAIVILLSCESCINKSFVAIRKVIDKYKLQSVDLLAFDVFFSHTVKNPNDLPIRSSFTGAIWDVSLAWLEVNVF
jgi:hypothetical protein